MAPPAWLTDEAEVAKWQEVTTLLRGMGVFTDADVDAVAGYCHDWVELMECRAVLQREGRVCAGDSGSPYQHPLVGVRNKALDRMRRFWSSFGLTAADRARVAVDAPKSTIAKRNRGGA